MPRCRVNEKKADTLINIAPKRVEITTTHQDPWNLVGVLGFRSEELLNLERSRSGLARRGLEEVADGEAFGRRAKNEKSGVYFSRMEAERDLLVRLVLPVRG